MAHAQKPDFAFRRNGRVHLNRWGRQFSRLLAAEVCASAVVMVVMLDTPCSAVVWRVLATHSIRQFPLQFPSHASPCAVTFQLESIPQGATSVGRGYWFRWLCVCMSDRTSPKMEKKDNNYWKSNSDATRHPRWLWVRPRNIGAYQYGIKIYFNKVHSLICGPGSSVGIATGYGLDGPGIESRWGARFSVPVQTGHGAHPASCTMGTGSFPGVKSGRGVTLTLTPF